MKRYLKKVLLPCVLLIVLLALSLLGASAATSEDATAASTVQRIASSADLVNAVNLYKQNNPTAAQHRIAAGHKLVYSENSSFKDNVNATTSVFSCYARRGAMDLAGYTLASGGTTSNNGFNVLKNLGITAVSDTTGASGREILVGVVDRAAQAPFRAMVDVNEFGIMVTEDHIILMAWQDAALKACVDIFKAYLSANNLTLPVGFTAVGVADAKWKVDFVRPAGANIALTAGQFVNDDSLQFLYTGSGVTRDAYLTYCTQLAGSGYTLVWQNTVGNNEFRMYQSTAKGTALYVAYNDYTYRAEFDALYQTNYGTADDAFAPEFERCIRLVSSPLSSVSLPANINTQQSYTKVTSSYMTTLGIASSNVGAGYVIMLEDGRFVVIDGGKCTHGTGGTDWCAEVQLIWNAMLNLYKKAYGASAVPTAQRPLHVAAWYLTHGHADHYGAFQRMITLIGQDASKKAVFKMDYIIANLPGNYSLFENTSTTWGYNNNANIHAMRNAIGNVQYIKAQTGQRIYLANLMIEVLMTYQDHLPNPIYNTNDTNTILRFHIQTSSVTSGSVTSLPGNAVRVLFLGDSWRPASRYLCAMYGSYLKSDISQLAHHGNIGCEQELYQTISPRAVLFNHDKSSLISYVWGSTTSSNPETKHAYAVDKYVVNRATMNGKKLLSVQYVWAAVAGTYTTLQFTTAGAQYESAFDLVTGRAITYVDASKASSQQNGFVRHSNVCTAHVGLKSCTEDYTCELCGEAVSAPGHDFTGAWQKDATGHWHVCKRTGCSETDTKVQHTPAADDGDCTTAIKCTVCDAVTTAASGGHAGGTATCSAKPRCATCGKSYGALAAHTPDADDGDCTTPIPCTACGGIATAGASAHTGGTASCTQKAECTVCGKEYGAFAAHTPATDDGDCTTPIPCTVCGGIATAGASAHTGGTASCTQKAECTVCGKAYGELASHADANGDGECDVCAQMLTPSDSADAEAPSSPGDAGEESGGGSVAVLVLALVATVLLVAVLGLVLAMRRRIT